MLFCQLKHYVIEQKESVGEKLVKDSLTTYEQVCIA